MKIFNKFIASSAALLAGAAATAGTAYFGGEEKKKGARAAGNARKQGYLDAIDTIGAAKDAAIKEQQPYADQGKQMVDWFKKYNTDNNFKYDMYSQYAKVGDPLYDYYEKKQTKELNRQMAARGRFGGGRAVQALAEQNAALSAKMSDLTDTRVAREINTNLQLLGSGQNAANNISQIQSQAGRDISNMEVALGNSNSQTEQAVSDASAGQIAGIGGALTGLISGSAQLGSGQAAPSARGGGGFLSNVGPWQGPMPAPGGNVPQNTGAGEWQGPMPYYGKFPAGRNTVTRINTGGKGTPVLPSVIPGIGVTNNGQVINPNQQEYVTSPNVGSNFARSPVLKY